MFTVEHAISLGGASSATGTSALLELDVRASFAAPVHRCRIVLEPGLDAAIESGDAAKVELGYDGTRSLVFTGRVASCERGLHWLQVEALSAFSALTTAFFNLLYEKQSAGDIVSNLLGRLDVSKGTVESGVTFASCALGDRESLCSHLNALARRCGFDFYADPEDRAVFKKYAPSRTHHFQYGAGILEFTRDATPPSVEGVEVYGESPVGQGQGEDASSWLTKKEIKGAAGKTSGRVLRVVDPTARSPNLATELARNLMHGYQVRARGRVRVLGAPEVRLGDAIRIEKLPTAAQNGTYRVTGVRHRLNRRHGFISDIDWEHV